MQRPDNSDMRPEKIKLIIEFLKQSKSTNVAFKLDYNLIN